MMSTAIEVRKFKYMLMQGIFMHESTKLKLMLYFTASYMIVFTIIALLNSNFEFLYYTLFMSLIIIVLIIYHEKLALSPGIAAGMMILAALHIFGGNIHINSMRLYDIWLFKGLRFDNLVHIVGGYVAALLSYSFIYPHLNEKARNHKVLLALILLFMASGLGALAEILELTAVLHFNAGPQVGDYLNNAFDLVYNLLGASLTCIYIFYFRKEKS